MGEKRVIKIPARFQFDCSGLWKVRRVAVYARVSTNQEEQENSLAAQVDYFTKLVNEQPGWKLYKIYVDDGISGTQKSHRPSFTRLIRDAEAGEIDLIVTKSLSRFARNTVDMLVSIRRLKEKGVEVFFEKENIYTFDSKGEVLLTILGSLAQEESRSISENIRWGKRVAYAKGKFSMPVSSMLGFQRLGKRNYTICEDEAKIVREMFFLALMGETPYSIATFFTMLGIRTPMDHSKRWPPSTVDSMLSNEKLKGDALLQKHFIVDFLTKKSKKNEGELPQYYISDALPAIIPKATFDYLQGKLEARKKYESHFSSKQGEHCIIVCGTCSCLYGRFIAHSGSKYARPSLRCNGFYKKQCRAPKFDEKRFLLKYYQTLQEWIYENRARLKGILLTIRDIFGKEVFQKAERILREKRQLAFDRITPKLLVTQITVTHDCQVKFEFLDKTDFEVSFEECVTSRNKYFKD